MPSDRPVRSLVVDDERMFADAVRLTLVDMGLDEVVVATSGGEALEVVIRAEPELVLVALDLRDTDGMELANRIAERRTETKLVAIAGEDEAPAARDAAASVFSGVIDKGVERPGFERVIRSVLDGEDATELSSPVRRARSAEDRTALASLTRREREILELLGTGASTLAIARELHLSQHTVRSHVQNVLLKLHLHSRLEAAAYAARHGFGPRDGTVKLD
jgi:two-component system, NarL family, nitrate/nitrite response regulator NarL